VCFSLERPVRSRIPGFVSLLFNLSDLHRQAWRGGDRSHGLTLRPAFLHFRYYILILACIVGKDFVWLRNACLAAALLFPAVAALHGIVLASLHLNSKPPMPGSMPRHSQCLAAVDMDIYGAFQLCAIGILAAPITVKLSRTYFNDPGRNAIFVWTILVLIGEYS
jgi:hypothetical protein